MWIRCISSNWFGVKNSARQSIVSSEVGSMGCVMSVIHRVEDVEFWHRKQSCLPTANMQNKTEKLFCLLIGPHCCYYQPCFHVYENIHEETDSKNPSSFLSLSGNNWSVMWVDIRYIRTCLKKLFPSHITCITFSESQKSPKRAKNFLKSRTFYQLILFPSWFPNAILNTKCL